MSLVEKSLHSPVEASLGESPDYVRLSLAAAMALGYRKGWFYRGAKCYCINLLHTYDSGCAANCAYCGLSRARSGAYEDKSFIRVEWPLVPYEDVLARIKAKGEGVRRICISMITNKRSLRDMVPMVQEAKTVVPEVPVSALIAPTIVHKQDLLAFKEAGVDWCGIAVDAATPALFDLRRGKGVKGPHRWDEYWRRVDEAVEIFGPGKISLHLVCGLGETEAEMVSAMQLAVDKQARIHLFSFYPEPGSAMAKESLPPLESYRRIQLAAAVLERGWARTEDFTFSETGQIRSLGISQAQLETLLQDGTVFMTRGCPSATGDIACNRPYANEWPDEVLRNYPFYPNEDDLALIRETVALG